MLRIRVRRSLDMKARGLAVTGSVGRPRSAPGRLRPADRTIYIDAGPALGKGEPVAFPPRKTTASFRLQGEPSVTEIQDTSLGFRQKVKTPSLDRYSLRAPPILGYRVQRTKEFLTRLQELVLVG